MIYGGFVHQNPNNIRLVPSLTDLLIVNPSPTSVISFFMAWIKKLEIPESFPIRDGEMDSSCDIR